MEKGGSVKSGGGGATVVLGKLRIFYTSFQNVK